MYFTYIWMFLDHTEIRLLRWSDFSDDLSYITLSGSRVKSKRNRVVPVPEYVRKELTIGDRNHNIFQGKFIHITEAILMGFGSVLRRLILSLIKTLRFTHLGTQGR